MKYSTATALLLAASISIAVAKPAKLTYYFDDEEDSGEREMLAPRQPYNLPTAPYYYQPRTMQVQEEMPVEQRKYQIVRKKKKPNLPGSEEDEPQDDEEESSEEEQDEEGGDEDEEESLDVPPWEELFPEEDKNTGMFDDQGGSGIGGGPHADATLPGGAPAPEPSGSFMSMFGFGGGESSNSGSSEGGPPGGPPPPQQGGQQNQRFRDFGPPPPHYQNPRARSFISDEEEDDDDSASGSVEVEQRPRPGPRARSEGVIFDGYRYIPVEEINVRRVPQPQPQPKRQSKTSNKRSRSNSNKKSRRNKNQQLQSRSLPPSSSTSGSKKTSNRPRYVLVPFHDQPHPDNREIRFSSRDNEGFKLESGPSFAPTEVWRWEGPPGGRPLRRGDNIRPNSGIYFTPSNPSNRPQRGSPYVRFNDDESDL